MSRKGRNAHGETFTRLSSEWNQVLSRVSEAGAQCDLLCEEFANDPDPIYVFLTPSGRLPEASIGQGRQLFRPLSYREVKSMLTSALLEARSADGLHVAQDYLTTLELEFE